MPPDHAHFVLNLLHLLCHPGPALVVFLAIILGASMVVSPGFAVFIVLGVAVFFILNIAIIVTPIVYAEGTRPRTSK